MYPECLEHIPDMVTWRELITTEMLNWDDSWDNFLWSTLDDSELDEPFDCTSGGTSFGKPFTLWTLTRVYFPVEHNGDEWCKSVERDPSNVPTLHLPLSYSGIYIKKCPPLDFKDYDESFIDQSFGENL